jgi:beta-lactamase class A
MNKLKRVIVIETLIIIGLIISLLYAIYSNPNNPNNITTQYCDKHFYDSQVCLLSPTIYTGAIKSNNLMILNLQPLKDDIQNYLNFRTLNSSVGLYILNMQDGVSFGINSNQAYEPASLNKLPIAIIILKKVEKGELSLDTILPIRYEDRDNRSGTLYSTDLNEMTVRDLLYYMLTESDNTAFRVLEEQVTVLDLHDLSSYLDYYTKDINYTTLNNTYQITPKSTANIFLSLYLSTDLKPEDSELILKDLTNTTYSGFDLENYSGLPSNITVADKYAQYYLGNEKFFHDCGIMYIQGSRTFYCVMTKNLDKEPASIVIGDIVNKVYNYIIQERQLKSNGNMLGNLGQ